MRKRLLYLMHVDWNWIKQRPHFIAEQLAEEFDVLTLYALSRSRKNLVFNPSGLRQFPIVLLPARIPFVSALLVFIHRFILVMAFVIFRPHTVWITHPLLFEYLPKIMMRNCTIVYDCMDDILSFPSPKAFKDGVARAEQSLINQATHIFCSSDNLKQKLIARSGTSEKISVVRNAYDGNLLSPELTEQGKRRNYQICYVGTVSEWLDFDALLYSLAKITDLEYHILGPIYSPVPNHDRIIFHGVVKHDDLYDHVKDYDCFIIPFKVNQLVESVDPVKLYEYINFNRDILAIRYDEIKRYEDFVYFYSDGAELAELISFVRRQTRPKYTLDQRERFLEDNTWAKRGAVIREVIGG